METFNNVLNIINNVVLGILTAGFAPQLIYVLLFFLKPKKYKPAKTQHKFGIVIPARNESAVIGNLIDCLHNLNYPNDLYEIFVIADNCTDNTAEIARNAGATVIERFDDTKRSAGWAYDYFYTHNLEKHPDIEVFIHFDADNLVHPDYLTKMNDAFDSGVEFARGYSNSKNLTQNMCTCVSGLYYIRDSRFTCQARSALGLDQNTPGSGMMMSAELIRKRGWDAHGLSGDTEYCLNRMLEGVHPKYVSEAEYYEEQPATMKDVFNRNIRMGNGLNKLFYTKAIPMLFKFFWTFRISYIDMFLQLMFIPLAVLCCFWLPLYYGYILIMSAINYAADPATFWTIFNGIIIALTCLFYALFVLQTALAVYLEREKLKKWDKKTIIKSVFVFPFYMIIYMISITIGCLMFKPKWKAIRRSSDTKIDDLMGHKKIERENSASNVDEISERKIDMPKNTEEDDIQ